MIQTNIADSAFLDMIEQAARQAIRLRPPNEIIERHGKPFFERWMIARKVTVPTFVASRTRPVKADDPTPMTTELENLFLHRFLRSDSEDPHCHPWPNVSLVLHGWYQEAIDDGAALRTLMRGDIMLRAAEQRHSITTVQPGTLSLFATAPKIREWSFYPPDHPPVHHADYAPWKEANADQDTA